MENPEGKKINMKLSFARAEAIKNMLINWFPFRKYHVLGKGDLEPLVKPNWIIMKAIIEEVEVFLFSE